MIYAGFEIALGIFAICVGCIYYSFGDTLWHVAGVVMALCSVPAFAAAGHIIYLELT